MTPAHRSDPNAGRRGGQIAAEPSRHARIPFPDLSSETKDLITEGARRFLEEVPALGQMKLVMRLDLRARRDAQTWRIQFPDIDVKRDPAADAEVILLAPRSHFNELAKDGRLQHWRDAYENGYIRVAGREDKLKLIARVIEMHERREMSKKRRL